MPCKGKKKRKDLFVNDKLSSEKQLVDRWKEKAAQTGNGIGNDGGGKGGDDDEPSSMMVMMMMTMADPLRVTWWRWCWAQNEKQEVS